jgi:AcrR family transcriptional regulator
MSLRKQPKQRRSKEMVQSILEGAAIILSGDKLSFSTINISKQTGISVGSFYQYYKNKDEVLKDLIRTYSKKQNEDILGLFKCL